MKGSAARARHGVACVLLAAGGSRRLGRPKQLVRYRAHALIAHALAAAGAALPDSPIVVVLGAHALRLRGVVRRARRGVITRMNPRWEDGLATSLQAGLAATPRGTRAILVLLADQPRVDAAALRRLLAAWQRRPGVPAAATYLGRAGVPAILPRRCWRALRALRGDVGARALLRDTARLSLVAMPEAALDVDTAADLVLLERRS